MFSSLPTQNNVYIYYRDSMWYELVKVLGKKVITIHLFLYKVIPYTCVAY